MSVEAIYQKVESSDMPGLSSVLATVDDYGCELDAMMAAGSVGIQCISSGDKLAEGSVGRHTAATKTGQWMFKKKSEEVLEKERREREERWSQGFRKEKTSVVDVQSEYYTNQATTSYLLEWDPN